MDMTPAARAREIATHFEAKKTGFGQAQDGWSLTLRIQDADVPAFVRDAKKGTRFIVAVVEIDDTELPVSRAVSQPEKQPGSASRPPAQPVRADKERQKWATMPYAKQVVLRGQQPVFWAFLREMCAKDVRSEEQAARAVREICRVASRADIKPDTEAESYWLDLEKFFDAWKTQDQVA